MIRVGTCGFSFKDWVGSVYPHHLKRENFLIYYHKTLGLDLVEIDSSYYNIPSVTTVKRWVDVTDEKFLFGVKCPKEVTLNEYFTPNPLDIENKNIILRFVNAFRYMIESGKLLTFVFQFGPLFVKNKLNVEYLKRLRENFGDLPLSVEFRHISWLSPSEKEHTFNFLRNFGFGYVASDLPLLRNLPPLVPECTNEIGYFRFHGRNKDWFKKGAYRYDYTYTDEEIEEFIPHIKKVSEKTHITAVLFNNCHRGAALKNAIALRDKLIPKAKIETPIQMEFPF